MSMRDSLSRREFLGAATLTASGLISGCAASKTGTKGPAPFTRGALLHLGSNMWDDYPAGPDDFAKSEAEEKSCPNPVNPAGKRSRYHSYLQCHDDLWKKSIDHMAEKKMNLVFIDLGEGLFYPSHPELAVAGSWSVEKMRKELARIRSLGMEPLPKLNFSTCHDAWLKDYHRMVSTKKYYQVVADVIRDVCEIFDNPRLFHLGFDEEVPVAGKGNFFACFRQGELWWHDLEYTIAQVEKHGSRATIWSDKICDGREAFLKRMSKDVVMSAWYYGTNFTDKYLTWDASYEKKGGSWEVQRNLAASFVELDKAGFDILGCTSNWSRDEAAEAMVKFCKERIDPKHLLGLYTAPWCRTLPDEEGPKGKKITKTLEGIDLFAAAMDRYYPLR